MADPTPDMDAMAEKLRVFGHPVRLALLRTLKGGERSVGELEHATGIVQPGLSQQLAVLRKAGLVATRREAKQIFYSIDARACGQVMADLAALCGTASPIESAAPQDPGTDARPLDARRSSVAMFARVG